MTEDFCEKHQQPFKRGFYIKDQNDETTTMVKTYGCCACQREEMIAQ